MFWAGGTLTPCLSWALDNSRDPGQPEMLWKFHPSPSSPSEGGIPSCFPIQTHSPGCHSCALQWHSVGTAGTEPLCWESARGKPWSNPTFITPASFQNTLWEEGKWSQLSPGPIWNKTGKSGRTGRLRKWMNPCAHRDVLWPHGFSQFHWRNPLDRQESMDWVPHIPFW